MAPTRKDTSVPLMMSATRTPLQAPPSGACSGAPPSTPKRRPSNHPTPNLPTPGYSGSTMNRYLLSAPPFRSGVDTPSAGFGIKRSPPRCPRPTALETWL
jgi:hypothetical protein